MLYVIIFFSVAFALAIAFVCYAACAISDKTSSHVICSDCHVRVPVAALSLPFRCHSRCPLNQKEGTHHEADQTPPLGNIGAARTQTIRTQEGWRTADRQALETYTRRHSAEGVYPRPLA